MSRRKRSLTSLELRLPLVSAALIFGTVLAVSIAAYVSVRQTTILAATARLQGSAQQLGALLQGSGDTLIAEAKRVAANPIVRSYIRAPSLHDTAEVASTLEGVPQADRLIGFAVLDSSGKALLWSGPQAMSASKLTTPEIEHMVQRGGDATAGAFRTLGDTVVYPVGAPVRDRGNRPIGYIVQWRRQVSSREAQQQLGALFGGPGSTFYLSDTSQSSFTDLVDGVRPLPARLEPGGPPVEYTRDGQRRLAVASIGLHTPWLAIIEVPRSTVYQPLTTFLRRMGGIAFVLLLLGLVVAWTLSRSITRPLGELAAAADAINAGELSRRVNIERDDELGRVATAFNRLVQSFESSHREREERFHLLVDAVRDYAVFAMDLDGTVATWNRGAERLKGYREDEIVGRNFAAFYTPEDIAAGRPARNLEIALREGRVEDAGWRVRGDGSRFWADVVISLVRNHEGEAIGFAKITRDMTERRRVEEELRASNQALRVRSAELDDALHKLQEAQEALVRREKLAILGQLASGVGHELRNPLGVMSNAVYFLDAVMADPPEKVREYLGIIRNQIDLSEKIVSDLLDFARVKPPQRAPVSLVDVVQRQVERLGRPSGVQIGVHIPRSLPPVMVDDVQIGQVIFNLLTNAVQAIGDKGGTVDVCAQMNGMHVKLQVKDSGPGISAENIDRIFEPLFTTKARGMGLGLAVSRALAVANGGDILVESRPGEGATFTFTLPVEEVRAAG